MSHALMLFIANWKCYKTKHEIDTFVALYKKQVHRIPSSAQIIIAPPYPYIAYLSSFAQGFMVAAQDISAFNQTGEVSATQLLDCGTRYVLIGHSERRTNFAEGHTILEMKLRNATEMGLKVIFCVGDFESSDEFIRDLEVIAHYTDAIIAYEPSWAIGTGMSASREKIEEVIHYIRGFVKPEIKIVYGGSVNQSNITEFKQIKGLGGFLIGGASLEADSFINIIVA